ncbi:low molecular weight protein-tyrosine-phosphatase [Hoeflea marina]|nr:low molecular weight protein-tyrosine-phosphatase [Hoeflea marina]
MDSAESETKRIGSVLFVCLGNICRSPLAEGIFRHQLHQVERLEAFRLDSAGTGGWHAGDPPDPRSIAVARSHGIDISQQSARQIVAADFQQFDLILAMDRSNEATLKARAPLAAQGRIRLFLDHTLGIRADVPDPYHDAADGFEAVYRMLDQGCSALLRNLA